MEIHRNSCIHKWFEQRELVDIATNSKIVQILKYKFKKIF